MACIEPLVSTERLPRFQRLGGTCPCGGLRDWTRSARIWSGGPNVAKRLTAMLFGQDGRGLGMGNFLQPIVGTAEGDVLSRTCPQSCLPDGIPKGK